MTRRVNTLTGAQTPKSPRFAPLQRRCSPFVGRSRDIRRQAMAGLVVLAAGTGLGLSLSSCGGTNSPSSTSASADNNQVFVTKLNSVCDQYNQQQSGLQPPSFNPTNPTPQDLPAAATYLNKEVPLLQSLVTNIEKLGEPSQTGSRSTNRSRPCGRQEITPEPHNRLPRQVTSLHSSPA